MQRLVGLLTLLLGLYVATSAAAQSGSLIIDRSRPDRAPAATAASPPGAALAAGNVHGASGAVDAFTLQRLDVVGSSLPQSAFAEAAKGYIGRKVTRADLGKLSEQVGAVYAKSDIALYTVLVPQQTFDGGVLRVRVVEGYVSGIELKDQPGRPHSELSRVYAEALVGDAPLQKSALERQLGLIRDIPGAQPDIQILQGDKPGAVRLAVTPKVRRFEGTLAVNSRGATLLGKTQVELGAHFNSVLREGDRTDITFAFPTELERFQYVGVGHSQKVGPAGTSVSLNAGYLRTNPDLKGVELKGTAKTAGVTVVHPVLRSNQKNLYATVGLDGLDSDNALFGRQISREQTRALRLGAAYTAQTAKTVTTANVAVSQGLDALGARMANPIISEADFTKASAQLSYATYTERTAIRLAAAGQLTGDRLPASEKFAVGGAQFGRAFASAVISGDSGYAASAEFALRKKGGGRFAGSEAYVFADYGQVIQTKKLGIFRDDEVASAGAGVRLAVFKKAVVELEAAKALDDIDLRKGTRPLKLMLNLRSTF
jgi:hemolysin activation/secretion protein